MPTAYTDDYPCPRCHRAHQAIPLAPCLPIPSPRGAGPTPCEECEQGEHEACMRWLCTCPSSVHFTTNNADRIRY